MTRSVKTPRSYDSTGRRAQAQETRARIIEVALARFLRDGFAATTIPAVAAEAGVSVETIYKAFANKAGLLKAAVDVTVAGDHDEVAIRDRDPVRSILAEPDPHEKLRLWAANYVSIAVRTTPLHMLVRDAAASDPSVAEVFATTNTERHLGMSEFARHLGDGGWLRHDVTVDEAADVLWSVSSPTMFELLALQRGWQTERMRAWIADTLDHALLR